jgi:hypothetical protein
MKPIPSTKLVGGHDIDVDKKKCNIQPMMVADSGRGRLRWAIEGRASDGRG